MRFNLSKLLYQESKYKLLCLILELRRSSFLKSFLKDILKAKKKEINVNKN